MDLFSHFTYTDKATNLLLSRPHLKKASGSAGHNNQRIPITRDNCCSDSLGNCRTVLLINIPRAVASIFAKHDSERKKRHAIG